MTEVASPRVARKRAAKRAALIAVACRALAAGRTSISIQELTDEADMGFGSFYTHFPDKESLFEAAITDTMERFGAYVDSLAEGLDGLQALALGIRLTCRLQRVHPELGQLVLNLGTGVLLRDDGLMSRLRRDLRRAVEDGDFPAWTGDHAALAVGGAVLGTLQLLDAEPELDAADIADDVCCRLLLMLGVDATTADEHARSPLPEHALALPQER